MDCCQGSVLGPLKFISYADEVSEVFTRHVVNFHLFADDKQLLNYGKFSGILVIIKVVA